MIIGLTGQKGVGKSMVASYLEEHHDFERMAFADSLKEAAKIVFQLDDQDLYTREGKSRYVDRWGKTVRTILQEFGTEVGRQIDEDVWVKSVGARIDQLNHNRFVIEDVRFENEADFINEKGGKIWGILRPGHQPSWPEDNPEYHKSEFEMWASWYKMVDTTFANVGSRKSLFAMIERELCTDTENTSRSNSMMLS